MQVLAGQMDLWLWKSGDTVGLGAAGWVTPDALYVSSSSFQQGVERLTLPVLDVHVVSHLRENAIELRGNGHSVPWTQSSYLGAKIC